MKISDAKKTIGQNIKRLRKRNGWTQRDVAEKVGLSRSAISQIELGQVDVNFTKLKKFAEVFDIDYTILVKGGDDSTTAKYKAESIRLAALLDEKEEEIVHLQSKLIKAYDKISAK